MEGTPPAPRSQWMRPGPAGPGLLASWAFAARTRLSQWGLARLGLLARLGWRLTVRDLFGTPGDTLLTAAVCRQIKQRWPRLHLNCLTKNADLLEHDPNLDEINQPPGVFLLDFWYLDLMHRKDRVTNLLAPTLRAAGFTEWDYRARVYLTDDERAAARRRLEGLPRPLIAVNTLSAQPAKNWPADRWSALAPELAKRGSLVQLGDAREPELPGVARRLAGLLTRRESMAVLGECALFVGPVTFLMHAANGLDVPAVIIFGGSHTPANAGYAQNRNLYTELPCSGCWLTGLPGAECPHGLACLTAITPPQVLAAADELLAQPRATTFASPSTISSTV